MEGRRQHFEPARKSCMDSGGAEVLLPVSCGHGQVVATEDASGRARQPLSLLSWGPWGHPALQGCINAKASQRSGMESACFGVFPSLSLGAETPKLPPLSGTLATLSGCPGLVGRTHTAKLDSAVALLAWGAQAKGECSWAGSTCTLAPSKGSPSTTLPDPAVLALPAQLVGWARSKKPFHARGPATR